MAEASQDKGVFRSGVLLGVGLGGFVDGIVLHQILQWHHMLTSAGYPPDSVPNLQLNTLADGLFHAGTWVITLIGLLMLWQAGRRGKVRQPTSAWLGLLALGWGLFNVVEGLVDHQILGIHHVRSGPNELVYDLAFLAFGALLILLGWRLWSRRPLPR